MAKRLIWISPSQVLLLIVLLADAGSTLSFAGDSIETKHTALNEPGGGNWAGIAGPVSRQFSPGPSHTQTCVTSSHGSMALLLLASVASFALGRYTARCQPAALAQYTADGLRRTASQLLVKLSSAALSLATSLGDLASQPATAVQSNRTLVVHTAPEDAVPPADVSTPHSNTSNISVAEDSCSTNIDSIISSSNDQPTPMSSSTSNSTSNAGQQTASPPNIVGAGWTCVFSSMTAAGDSVSCNTNTKTGSAAPSSPAVTANDIRLGVLLGAGAFGKVYQGTWHGTAVAVKIITQIGMSAAQQVRREAELMLRVKHANVVQSHQVVIWQRTGSSSEGSMCSSNRGSVGQFPQNSSAGSRSSNSSRYSNDSTTADDQIIPSTGGGPSGAGFVSNGRRNSTGGSAGATETAQCWLVGESEGTCELECDLDDGADDTFVETQTWIVQELCDGGTLDDAARDGKVDQPMAQISSLLDISRGMQYLHSNDILHGDLKCANVCLKRVQYDLADPHSSSSSDVQYSCKVADFSLTRTLDAGKDHHSTRSLGTVTYLAPELLTEARQTPACDVYSFGMLIWELLHKRPPFSGCLHEVEIIEKIVVKRERPAWGSQDPSGPQGPSGSQDLPGYQPEEPSPGLTSLSPDLIRLAEQCWDHDPSKRPTFVEITARLEQMRQDLAATGTADGKKASGRLRRNAMSPQAAARVSSAWAGSADDDDDEPDLRSELRRSSSGPPAVAAVAAAVSSCRLDNNSSSSSSSSAGRSDGSSTAPAAVRVPVRHSASFGRSSSRLSTDLEPIPEQKPLHSNSRSRRFGRTGLHSTRQSVDSAGTDSQSLGSFSITSQSLGNTSFSSNSSSSEAGGRKPCESYMPEDLVASSPTDHPSAALAARLGRKSPKSAKAGELGPSTPAQTSYEAFAEWLTASEDTQLSPRQDQGQPQWEANNQGSVTASCAKSPSEKEQEQEDVESKGVTWIPRTSSDVSGKPAAPHSGYWD